MLHTHEVTGARPVVSTNKENPHHSVWVFFFAGDQVLEPIYTEMPGGHLLPPVQKLGDDPTAAGGGGREGSEWQWPVGDEGAPSPRTSTGYHNGWLPLFLPLPRGKNANRVS